MIEKEKLKDYARKLMFEMNDEEYSTLQEEFEVILKQMDLIGKIDNIKDVEPMTFPYINKHAHLRDDVTKETLKTEDIMLNVKEKERNQVKVPKVVE